MPFEINAPLVGLLNGDINVHVHEFGSVAPISILEADKAAAVHVTWSLSGALVPFTTGTWYVSAFLESMGPGPDKRLPIAPGAAVPLTPQPGVGPVAYNVLIPIPANTIEITSAEITKPYKLVVTVTYSGPTGQPGPMAGFSDGPMLQFYRVDVPA
ncbi:MAG: hypothetical protein HGA45_18135 [Chloroflexales bacterium]|nr:hypothetical protein [Chloroflexales bacterium]